MYGVRFLLWLLAVVGWLEASESPERECCDLEYPQLQSTTTTTSSTVATSTGSGSNIKTTIAILNCLLARQFCFEDSSCSAILEIIPRVCGPELVRGLRLNQPASHPADPDILADAGP
ncbi:hypothetical protein QE152_g19403 [Popillia japonica]|uniref:Uncharacterized protein n=1 Tax=Popillia japonica TaxID=7064 RepID=A0AAW1KUN6_POPJA